MEDIIRKHNLMKTFMKQVNDDLQELKLMLQKKQRYSI